MQVHRTKCTGVLKNILCPHFQSVLREDIQEGPYSLLVDGATDIAVHKQLRVCIQYFSQTARKVITTFLMIVQLVEGTAAAVVAGIKRAIAHFGRDHQKLRGIGCDNASVNTGHEGGVHALLKREVPHLILVRCVCHSVQLAVSEATSTLPAHLELLINQTYAWFARSTLRQNKYKEV